MAGLVETLLGSGNWNGWKMCGIAGIHDAAAVKRPEHDELQSMVARLHHRGPDGVGIHVRGPVGLAYSRLSIIDLEGGSQPIHNEDGSVWIVFNGEISITWSCRQSLSAKAAAHQDKSAVTADTMEYVRAFIKPVTVRSSLNYDS